MSPSFSSKNGIRYRFYVSSALLRGRKAAGGSVGRIAAAEIESAVRSALRTHQKEEDRNGVPNSIGEVERVVIGSNRLLITTASTSGDTQKIRTPWSAQMKNPKTIMEGNATPPDPRSEGLIQSIVRAHVWMRRLQDGKYESIEQVAEADGLHPKVIRQNLRLAFLSPEVTSSILQGTQPATLSLARVPKLLPLPWIEHQSLID